MTGEQNSGYFGEQRPFRPKAHQTSFSDASPHTVNGQVAPHGQMHPYGQGAHQGHASFYDRQPHYGQMSSHGYFNPAPNSHIALREENHRGPSTAAFPTPHMPSSGRHYGEPHLADLRRHSLMAPHNGLISSHLPSPTSPTSHAYNAASRQRYDGRPADSSPTHGQSRYPEKRSPYTRFPHKQSSMNSQRDAYSPPRTIQRQPDRAQDRSPDRAAHAVVLRDGNEAADMIKRDTNAEESLADDSMFLRAIALAATSRADTRKNDRIVQHSVDRQLDDHHQAVELQLAGQHVLEQADDTQEVRQQLAVWNPTVQKSAVQQQKDDEPQDDESIATASLSQVSTTSDSGEEDQHSSDQDVDDDSEERAATPQFEDGVDMMDKYAFNFAGEAYNHHIPQQLTIGIAIHVGSLAALTNSLRQHREEAENNSAMLDQDVIPPPLPHPNELQEGLKTIECVWVGMLPRPAALLQIKSEVDQATNDAAGEGSSNKPTKKRVKKIIAIAHMSEEDMKITQFDKDALRVVAKKSDKVTRDTHLYALLNPSNITKRCKGFKVGFDDVFYFREFRDDTARSALPRKQATMAKVRANVFAVGAPAVLMSQSPARLNGESSASALSSIATPSPAPDMPALRSPVVAPQSPGCSNSQANQSTPSSSKATSGKTTKEDEAKSGKRKAQDPIIDTLMKQRGEARKKARAEGYSVPSDLKLRESVETDDQDEPAVRVEDSNEGHMNLSSEYFADVDEPVDPTPSSADPMRMGSGSGANADEEAYPEHAVRAEDPQFRSHNDNLIRELARLTKLTAKVAESVAFRGKDGQVIDKNSKVVRSISHDSDGYDRDGEGQSSSAARKESASLVEKIMALANELATSQDVVGLQQALILVQSVQNRRGPPKTSALGLYLNVPTSKDISMKDCAEQLKQLRTLFPGIDDDNDIHDHVLAWMLKGLHLTGQSLSIDLVSPCLIAFAEQYRSKFGHSPEGQPNRMSRDVLVDMICCARDEAEEMRRFVAVENGADRANLEAEGDCRSHPYIDPDEEIVYQPAIWERPEEKR